MRSRQSLREKVWLPGKRESFNILVNKSFVSHAGPVEKGRLQYYYPEHVARDKCHSSGAAITTDTIKTEAKLE